MTEFLIVIMKSFSGIKKDTTGESSPRTFNIISKISLLNLWCTGEGEISSIVRDFRDDYYSELDFSRENGMVLIPLILGFAGEDQL